MKEQTSCSPHPCLFQNATTLLRQLAIGVIAVGCAEQSSTPASAWRVERIQAGDTAVVRNIGVGSSLADLTLEEELVIGKTAGADNEMFGRLRFASATADGGVVLAEVTPHRIQRFDSTGRFMYAYGQRGEGPGEFMMISRIAVDTRGRVFHWDLRHRVVTAYDSDGKFLRSIRPRPDEGLTAMFSDFVVDSTGVLSGRATLVTIADNMISGDRQAIIRVASDGKVIANVPQPAEYGAKYSGPMSPRFAAWFVFPGVWASAHNGSYQILLHLMPSGLVRIESDLVATQMPKQEREDRAASASRELKEMGSSVHMSVSLVPQTKPFFKSIVSDQSNRIWVELYRSGRRITEMQCPNDGLPFELTSDHAVLNGPANPTVGCSGGKRPEPVPTWVEPTVYDIFQPTGEFAGRLALPENSEFRAALANRIWLVVSDSLGAQTIRRYRVVPKPDSPASAFWK